MSEDKVRIVPVEPTGEMMSAACRVAPHSGSLARCVAEYKAAIAAAPASDCVPVKRDDLHDLMYMAIAWMTPEARAANKSFLDKFRALLGGEHG